MLLLMSSATVICMFWCFLRLKPVAMVLFMLCSAVLVEWLLFEAMLCGDVWDVVCDVWE